VIVSLHVATGALGGVLAGTRARALALGPVLHFVGDRVPHQDIASHRFEVVSGAVEVLALAIVRGATDAAVVGALAASLPDVEHVVRLPRPGGRKLFPSHRIRGWHHEGGVSARAQLFIAGVLLGAVLGRR
jgi:hypothetical protein